MLAAEYVVEQLARWGVDTFFVLTGGAIAPLIDAVASNSKVKYYCFQHEQAASMAADGYYRVTGKLACVMVTSGPGVQNILNGVCGCWFDSLPALFISGQVNMMESLDALKEAVPRQVGFQETPVVDCFKPFTKYCAKVRDIGELPDNLAKFFKSAISGRKGPSLLDFPVNVQMSDLVAPFGDFGDTAVHFADLATYEVPVSTYLLSAMRPLFVLGEGARASKDGILELSARLKIPYTLSWSALDLAPWDSPLNLGTHGVYGKRVANFALQNADLLIILGSRLDTRQTGGKLVNFSRESKKIMVDIDKNEALKLVERGCRIDEFHCCDVGTFLKKIEDFERDESQTSRWLQTIQDWISSFGTEVRPEFPGFVSPYRLIGRLSERFPVDAIIVVDTGATLVWTYQSLQCREGIRVFSNLGNSSMGYALSASVGAALGDPSRPVYCIIGDGGMQQNIQELATAIRYNLNIKIMVFNNNGFGIIKQFQNSYLHGRHVATSREEIYGARGIDFCGISRAYGVPAVSIKSDDDIEKISAQLSTPDLILYDILVHENQGIQPKTDFGNSLCNMSPFIDKAHEMIAPALPRIATGGWQKL